MVEGIGGGQVDVTVQDLTQLVSQPGKPKQADTRIRTKLHEEVDIGGFRGLVSGRLAKKVQFIDRIAFQQILLAFEQGYDLLAFHLAWNG